MNSQIKAIITNKVSVSEQKTPDIGVNNCAFLATQEAVYYFTGKGLSEETMNQMQVERREINRLLLQSSEAGYGEATTFVSILPRLKQFGIIPTEITTYSDKIEVIDTLLHEFGVTSTTTGTTNNKETVGINLPAIFISAKNGDPEDYHSWFCPDLESYNMEMNNPHHTKNYPDIQAVVSIDKL